MLDIIDFDDPEESEKLLDVLRRAKMSGCSKEGFTKEVRASIIKLCLRNLSREQIQTRIDAADKFIKDNW